MLEHKFLATVVIGAAIASAIAPSTNARAQVEPQGPGAQATNPVLAALTACEKVSPNASLTLAEGQQQVEAMSRSTYGGKDCNAFVVDVDVTSKSVGPNGPSESSFAPFADVKRDFRSLGPAACAAADIELNVSFYAMRSGAWKWIGGGLMKATGGQVGAYFSGCMLTAQGSYKTPRWDPLPAPGKTDKVRIVAVATKAGKKISAVAGVQHPVPGPR